MNALPVEPVGKIVSASTGVAAPTLLTPYPRASVASPFSTIAMAMPGTPIFVRRLSTRASKSLGGAAASGAEKMASVNSTNGFMRSPCGEFGRSGAFRRWSGRRRTIVSQYLARRTIDEQQYGGSDRGDGRDQHEEQGVVEPAPQGRRRSARADIDGVRGCAHADRCCIRSSPRRQASTSRSNATPPRIGSATGTPRRSLSSSSNRLRLFLRQLRRVETDAAAADGGIRAPARVSD